MVDGVDIERGVFVVGSRGYFFKVDIIFYKDKFFFKVKYFLYFYKCILFY